MSKKKRAFAVDQTIESRFLTKGADGLHVPRGERGHVLSWDAQRGGRVRYYVRWRNGGAGWYDEDVLLPAGSSDRDRRRRSRRRSWR